MARTIIAIFSLSMPNEDLYMSGLADGQRGTCGILELGVAFNLSS